MIRVKGNVIFTVIVVVCLFASHGRTGLPVNHSSQPLSISKERNMAMIATPSNFHSQRQQWSGRYNDDDEISDSAGGIVDAASTNSCAVLKSSPSPSRLLSLRKSGLALAISVLLTIVSIFICLTPVRIIKEVSVATVVRNIDDLVDSADRHRSLGSSPSSSSSSSSSPGFPSAKQKIILAPTSPYDQSGIKFPINSSNALKLEPKKMTNHPHDVVWHQSHSTVVTAYYKIPSKHSPERYSEWMANMLSLQDPMIIFTEPNLVDVLSQFRYHAKNRTAIVPVSLDDLPIASAFGTTFWEDQLGRDPEKDKHRSFKLFWIWLSKTWFVSEAIKLDLFRSEVFVWSDIGCFRNTNYYNGKTMVMHPERIPRDEVVQMAFRKPIPPNTSLFDDKFSHRSNFYHSGTHFAGYKDTVQSFHEHFVETIDEFVANDMFLGDDQTVLQSTCLRYQSLCAYVHRSSVNDNSYFGLRYFLHHTSNSSSKNIRNSASDNEDPEFKFWRIRNFRPKLSSKRERKDIINWS